MPNKNARAMRKEPTRDESRVWRWLCDRRFDGHKFRRQHPIGTYIVDFYCLELRLAIELDGQHHTTPGMSEYDDERTAALNRLGIEVQRIPNDLFKQDPQLVAQCLKYEIERRRQTLTRPSATLSRPAGEGS